MKYRVIVLQENDQWSWQVKTTTIILQSPKTYSTKKYAYEAAKQFQKYLRESTLIF